MDSTVSIKPVCNEDFLSFLNRFSDSKKFWIAYSGGMDSSVLIHLFFDNKNKFNQDIEAVYVNHGLQDEADDWAQFCNQQCQQYLISFTELKLTEACPKGKSIESWAREQRYALIEKMMNENDVLFTAHHKDDQVETFFLQALRGAGPRGLASMPVVKEKSKYFLARPLLDYSRNDLTHYANEHQLVWQNDKSNDDNRFDRNYFRNELSPLIEKRWPAYRETISRLINNQNDYRELLNEIALDDLSDAKSINGLDVEVIKKLSHVRQKNLIFNWINELNLKSPGSRNIETVISDVIYSNEEKSPCVNWANVEVRRYKNKLYAMHSDEKFNNNIEYKWKPEEVLTISEQTLSAKSSNGKGIAKNKINNAEFVVRFRQGGEVIRPENCSHSKTIKQLFQEKAVLPWFRDKVPLIYLDDKLIAVPGFCIDERFSANKNEPSWQLYWSGYEEAVQV